MKHEIRNKKDESVGWWDDQEYPRTYHTQRSYKARQIFIHPKYNSAVGLDIDIIKKHLIPNKITRLSFLIVGFEKESFFACIDLNEFMQKGKEVNFSKNKKDDWWSKQIILSLNGFHRVYGGQQRLI